MMQRDHSLQRVMLAAFVAVIALVLLATGMRLSRSLTDYDRACLSKPLGTIGQCFIEVRLKRLEN